MQRGKDEQQRQQLLEARRHLARYGLEEARRHTHLLLADDNLGLSAQVDLVLEAPEQVVVVEFKAGRPETHERHRLQLAAYLILAERAFNRPGRAFIWWTESDHLEAVSVDAGLRSEVLQTLAAIREMLATAALPPPCAAAARCQACEYRFFCSDVF